MIEKLVSGETWTEDLPVFSPTRADSAPRAPCRRREAIIIIY